MSKAINLNLNDKIKLMTDVELTSEYNINKKYTQRLIEVYIHVL